MKFFKRLSSETAGATAIEYGFIAALIALASISAFNALSGKIESSTSTHPAAQSSD